MSNFRRHRSGLWLSDQKPRMHRCDPGTVAHNCARMGLPVPDLPMPFWEGAGNKVYDYSGQKNNATINGTVRWVPSSSGISIEYQIADNGNGYISIPDKVSLRPGTGDFSIFMLLFLGAEDADGPRFFTKGAHTGDDLQLYVSGSKVTWQEGSDWSGRLESSASFGTNVVLSVTIIRKGTTGYIYINGILDNSGTRSGNYNSSQQIELGRVSDYSTTTQWDGNFISFSYWVGQALSPSQVATLSNDPYGMFEPRRRPPIWSVPSGPTYTLDAGSGAFTLTGQDISLLLGRLLNTEAGAFSLNGQAANLLLNRLLSVESGAFTLTGQSANLLLNRILPAESGIFSLSGTSVNLLLSRVLGAEAGTFTLTGTNVDLIYSGAGGPTYTLTAESGSFVLTGTNASLLVNRILAADSGAFTLSGQDATLLLNRLLAAGSGSFTLSGQDVILLANKILNTEAGTFTLAGQDAALLLGRALSAEAGSFTLTGQDTTLLAYRKLNAEAGTFDLTGQDVILTWSGATLAVGKLTITFTPRKPGHTFTPRKPGITLTGE